MRKYSNHFITDRTITILYDKGPPSLINSNDTRFEQIKALIEQQKLAEIPALADQSGYINATIQGRFVVKSGVIYIDGEAVPNGLSDKLLEFVNQGRDTAPLEEFWYKLSKNPSADSRKDLFDFLKFNKIPILKNGNFVAYKKVTKDFKDCHTKTFDNSPGKILTMKRSLVNSDRNQTCSAGLHVAAWEYAKNFSGAIMIEVEVDPKDVVSVPVDYKRQKMRVCRYRVIGEATKEITDLIYN